MLHLIHVTEYIGSDELAYPASSALTNYYNLLCCSMEKASEIDQLRDGLRNCETKSAKFQEVRFVSTFGYSNIVSHHSRNYNDVEGTLNYISIGYSSKI